MKLHIFFLTLLTVICPAICMEEGNDNNNDNNSNIELQRKLAQDRRIREEQDREFAETLRKDQKRKHERKLNEERKRLRTIPSKEEVHDDSPAQKTEQEETEQEKMRKARLRRLDSNNNNQSLSTRNSNENYFTWLPNELIEKIIIEHGINSFRPECECADDYLEYPKMMHFVENLKATNRFFRRLLSDKKIKKLVLKKVRTLVTNKAQFCKNNDNPWKYLKGEMELGMRNAEDSDHNFLMPIAAIKYDIDLWFAGYLKWLSDYAGQSPDYMYHDQIAAEYPLSAAALNGSVRVAKMLIDHGAQINVGRNGVTPLMCAATNDQLPVAKLLLERGADINAQAGDDSDDTALIVAARSNSLAVAKLLLKYGANINVHDKAGRSALMWAVIENSLPIAKLLLKYGADVNARDEGGRSAFDLAKSHDMKKLLKWNGAQRIKLGNLPS